MKTAVEWYCEKSIVISEELRAGKMTFAEWFKEQAVILKQAKEMEKSQMIDAHIAGHNAPSSTIKNWDAEQYYNETFNK